MPLLGTCKVAVWELKGCAMAIWAGAFVGGFIVAILIPLFLFYFAGRQTRKPRTAFVLRGTAVLASLLATIAASAGSGGKYPFAGLVATAVCFFWAVLSTARSSTGRRMNGWQRLAMLPVVVWVVWSLIFSPLWLRGRQMDQALHQETSCLRIFTDTPKNDDYCIAIAKADTHAAIDANPWWLGPIIAFVPLLLAWGLASVCVRLYRWVRAGFKGPQA